MRKNRIESIDFLGGLVMIIMVLDHVRDYFFFGSFTSNPSDLAYCYINIASSLLQIHEVQIKL